MEGRERATKIDLRRVDDEGGAYPARTLCCGQQHPVVRPDEHRAVLRDDAEVSAPRTNARVHYHEVYRFGQLVHAGSGGRRAFADVEGWDVMAQVHYPRLRARPDDDRVTHADPCVVRTEVGHEADDRLHETSPIV